MLVSSKVCNSNVTVSAHKQLNWEHWFTLAWPLFIKGKVFKISQSDLTLHMDYIEFKAIGIIWI